MFYIDFESLHSVRDIFLLACRHLDVALQLVFYVGICVWAIILLILNLYTNDSFEGLYSRVYFFVSLSLGSLTKDENRFKKKKSFIIMKFLWFIEKKKIIYYEWCLNEFYQNERFQELEDLAYVLFVLELVWLH